jgi:digeranylgeranylglycerophospholipid reductase
MSFDVIVVGGGPAGLSCALECSHSGTSTLLIEKDEIGRAKKSWEVFPQVISNFNLKECVVNWTRRDRYIIPSRLTSDFLLQRCVVDQAKFSKLMCERGSFAIWDRTEVTEAKRKEEKVILTTPQGDVEASLVVDASGSSTFISHSLAHRLPYTFGHLSYGVMIDEDVACFDIDNHTCLHLDFVLDTEFGLRPAELWVYPFSSSLLDVGIGHHLLKGDIKSLDLSSSTVHNVAQDRLFPLLQAEVKRQFGVEIGKVEREYYGMGKSSYIPSPYHDNLLIIGEASGLIQPNYNYGFDLCLIYGRIAGKVASEAVKEGNTSKEKLKAYKEEVKKNEVLSYTTFSWGREMWLALCALWGTGAIEGIIKALTKMDPGQGKGKVSKLIGERKLTRGEKLDFAALVTAEEIASLGFRLPHLSQLPKYLRSRFF